MSDPNKKECSYSEKPNSSDTISRQAAIDEIGEWIKAFLENGHKESAADARLIQDGIIQLPSAQPVDKDINVPTNDYISRQAAIDEAEEWIKTYNSGRGGQREQDAIKHVISGIKKLPSAQPEPAIPISWLEKEIEHLESRENSFAVLDAMQLKALIKRWRGEQNENT